MPHSRVAVIAVHGVADQQPGETARAVADLLVTSAPDGVAYISESTDDLSLRVEPLPAQPEAEPKVAGDTPATPRGEDRPAAKSFGQSLRSDFQAQGWAAAESQRKLPPASSRATQDVAAPPTEQDRGIAFTNYLLAKHVRNGATPEAYETTARTLHRRDAAAPARDAQVDVYEMYWADLSRLSGSMPRILSELFTLVFRLSKLGRETVDEMRGQLERSRDASTRAGRAYASAWTLVARLQIALDWLFVNGLALLFAQLGLLGILLVALGYTAGSTATGAAGKVDETHLQWLHYAVAGALVGLAALRMLYCLRRGRWRLFVAPAIVLAVAGAALAMGIAWLQWVTAFTLLAALTAVNESALRVADDRFPFVHVVGRWMWAACAVLLVASAAHESPTPVGAGADDWRAVWVHATLFTTENVLLLVKLWWIVISVVLAVWFAAGQRARTESGYATRASVATGRLGITVSLGMFLVVTMTTWALVNGVLGAAVRDEGYSPYIFAFDRPPAGPAAAEPAPRVRPCPAPAPCCTTATPRARRRSRCSPRCCCRWWPGWWRCSRPACWPS